MNYTNLEIISTFIFSLAILHTFCAGFFKKLSHKYEYEDNQFKHKIFHILSELELIFVLWAILLIISMIFIGGWHHTILYIKNLRFIEPFFVLTLMMITGTKPIIYCANNISKIVSNILYKKFKIVKGVTLYFICLFIIPLLGSLISEPAAMTISALMLNQHFFSKNLSTKFKYASLAILLVNISVGGALSSFAAPPILMVANTWNWSTVFIFQTFGIKAMLAVLINTVIAIAFFHKNLSKQYLEHLSIEIDEKISLNIIFIHLVLLASIIIFAHYIISLAIILIIFLIFTKINKKCPKPIMINQSIMVGGFLSSLVIMGSMQSWWLKPLLLNMNSLNIFFGATALTAITDNAAITYLASLVNGLSDDFKYSIVAGAISGGGLTIIANAPNPIGASILQANFKGNIIKPLYLFIYAIPPTIVCIAMFMYG